MQNKIHKILIESINKVLNEGASPLLYHYCSLESLEKMLSSNHLFLSDHEQEYNGKGMNYMSLTRNRNSVQGYPYMQSQYSYGGGTHYNSGSNYLYCRLEIDGNTLNTYNNIKDKNNKRHNIKIKPFDYLYNEFGDTNGPSDAYWSEDEEERYHQPFSQAEDRLTSSASEIPHMDKYVKSIDVFIDIKALVNTLLNDPRDVSSYYEEIKQLNDLCHNYKINIYTKRSSFDLGNKRDINNDIVNDIINIFTEIYQTKNIRAIEKLIQ